MKNEDRRKQTIRQILDSTKELLREKNCHTITMKDIMEKSELSKGAIFHYVKNKDEIFAWVLQDRLEEINEQFMKEVEQGEKTFDGPMLTITSNLAALENANEVTNKVLMYLLGREDEPAVAEVLHHFYQRSVHLAKQWIVIGQQHGVIQESVDSERTAEMFVLLSFGLRVRSSFLKVPVSYTAQDLSSFMAATLKN
ncbi:TetR/AcrR family transcriptional regulator [Paenibacillus woosongensis]|uniref:TetR family transcriptional regulator n=1 Tax=Paenibacillus woosongensis TaxID=307580 RepID=A0A7X2Z3I6_9BACL|nr:TetR/AcrR family transcriptional regulator [Paenibacillus woosongensis]MUG46328.1 TetR family transcriptional regulator [Paenibacillus woosongensis]